MQCISSSVREIVTNHFVIKVSRSEHCLTFDPIRKILAPLKIVLTMVTDHTDVVLLEFI